MFYLCLSADMNTNRWKHSYVDKIFLDGYGATFTVCAVGAVVITGSVVDIIAVSKCR